MPGTAVKYRSLASKLLSIYLPLVAVAAILLFGVLEFANYRTQRADLLNELQGLAEVQTPAFVSSVWQLDSDQISSLLSELAGRPEIQGAAIIDVNGSYVGQAGDIEKLPAGSDLRIERKLNYASAGRSEDLGLFVIAGHTGPLWNDVQNRLLIDALILIVMVAALTLATFIATRRVIGEPLDKLRGAMAAAAQRNTYKPVAWDTNDEIGEVVGTYNALLQKQGETEAALKRHRNELEDRVNDRTRELQQKTELLETVLSNMSDGIVAFGRNLKLIAANDRLGDLLDIPRQQICAGMTFDDFKLAAPQLLSSEKSYWAKIHGRNGFIAHDFETQLQENTFVHIRGGPLPDGGFVSTYSDVSKRKQAELALRSQEREFRTLLDSAPDPMVISDRHGIITLANRQTETVTGYSREELIGQSVEVLMPERFRAGHGGFIAQYMSAPTARSMGAIGVELYAKRKNGEEFPVEVSLSPIETERGVMIASALRDITERKEAEKAMEAQRRQLARILNSSPVGVTIVGQDQKRLYANQRLAEMYGEEREALVGQMVASNVAASDRRNEIQQLLENRGEVRDFEAELQRSDGSKYWALVTMTPTEYDGNPAQLIWTYDISERKAAEQRIEEQRIVLEAVFENMDQGVSMMDKDLNFVASNRLFHELLDIPKEKFGTGSSMSEMLRFNAERGDYGDGDVEQLIEERLALARKFEPHRLERVRPDGTVLEIRGNPVSSGGFVSTFTDITERKEAEEALRGAYEIIRDSVNYASNIQRSTLPMPELFNMAFADHVIIWEPRDVVSGDIYWLMPIENGFVLGVADCTGHGVPGAFVTLVASSAFRYAVAENENGNPAKIISSMNRFIKEVLAQYTEDAISDDGLELGICRIDTCTRTVEFAGARFSLWIVNQNGHQEFKGNKTGIGYKSVPLSLSLENHEVALGQNDACYLFSDGLNDQVGGNRRRSFGKKRILDLLLSNQTKPMTDQGAALLDAFFEYQGDEVRRDDVTLIGFRL